MFRGFIWSHNIEIYVAWYVTVLWWHQLWLACWKPLPENVHCSNLMFLNPTSQWLYRPLAWSLIPVAYLHIWRGVIVFVCLSSSTIFICYWPGIISLTMCQGGEWYMCHQGNRKSHIPSAWCDICTCHYSHGHGLHLQSNQRQSSDTGHSRATKRSTTMEAIE